MENKADVKAIMARFQANGASSEETPSTGLGRPKQPVQPTQSGQGLQMKKVSESTSGGAAPFPPKPSFVKNIPSAKSDTGAPEPNKAKALASKFANSQDETNKPFIKHQLHSKPSFTQMSEPKAPLNKPSLSAPGTDPKPAVTKTKPSWVKEDSASSITSPPPAKIPPAQFKPSNTFFKLQQQLEEKTEVNTDTVNKPVLPVNSTVKPSSFRSAQNLFNKEPAEQSDSSVKPSVVNKLPLTSSNSIPPPKPLPSKKPSLKKPSTHIISDDPLAPKRNPLPNSLALGPAPAKPNRPPNVNLEAFRGRVDTPADGPKKPVAPPPLSHPSNHSNQVTPAPPVPPVPSLPPRHPAAINQTDEIYDDVDGPTNAPPPLPPVHPSQRLQEKDEDDDDDGELYEDLDDKWEAAEQKQEKKKEKDDKEEKKRLEAEKKEQKEREKKEQDARKKFKLNGPLEVLQKGKACVDYKGNKNELTLKRGESLDIIRVQGNPEGKWLGRTQDGSIGYVKTTSVEIDFNSLKSQPLAHEPELYDDIDVAPSDKSKIKGPGVVLPPLPQDGEEIYDDVDPSLDVNPSDPRQSPMKPRVFQWMIERGRLALSTKVVPPPSQFSGDSDQKGGAIDEEIYDDVDSQNIPPPPPPTSSIPTKEVDPKKQKKLEKEEKDFRKKFKYEGDIQVLHQVNIVPNLSNKKWSSKELPLKAGEKLDVIVKAVDNKFICRNEDGKFGYVSTSYVVTDDGDIYDDIGDDCIYDND